MRRSIRYTEKFKSEFSKIPKPLKEDFIILVNKYLNGDRLTSTVFKTFKLDQKTKVQEFKLRDSTGNWRAISFLEGDHGLTFIYAFHKKSQELKQKDKTVIIKRIKELS